MIPPELADRLRPPSTCADECLAATGEAARRGCGQQFPTDVVLSALADRERASPRTSSVLVPVPLADETAVPKPGQRAAAVARRDEAVGDLRLLQQTCDQMARSSTVVGRATVRPADGAEAADHGAAPSSRRNDVDGPVDRGSSPPGLRGRRPGRLRRGNFGRRPGRRPEQPPVAARRPNPTRAVAGPTEQLAAPRHAGGGCQADEPRGRPSRLRRSPLAAGDDREDPAAAAATRRQGNSKSQIASHNQPAGRQHGRSAGTAQQAGTVGRRPHPGLAGPGARSQGRRRQRRQRRKRHRTESRRQGSSHAAIGERRDGGAAQAQRGEATEPQQRQLSSVFVAPADFLRPVRPLARCPRADGPRQADASRNGRNKPGLCPATSRRRVNAPRAQRQRPVTLRPIFPRARKAGPTVQPVAVHVGPLRPLWLTAPDGSRSSSSSGPPSWKTRPSTRGCCSTGRCPAGARRAGRRPVPDRRLTPVRAADRSLPRAGDDRPARPARPRPGPRAAAGRVDAAADRPGPGLGRRPHRPRRGRRSAAGHWSTSPSAASGSSPPSPTNCAPRSRRCGCTSTCSPAA